jgi:hypothetical protein
LVSCTAVYRRWLFAVMWLWADYDAVLVVGMFRLIFSRKRKNNIAFQFVNRK